MTEMVMTSPGVYLISAPGGLFKIGQSKSPSGRLASIDPSGLGMTIAHVIPTERRQWLESYLHLAFRHRRSHREWFRLADEEVELIRSIPAADSTADVPTAVIALWEQNRRAKRTPIPGEPGPKPRPPDQLALVVSTRLPPDVRAWLAEQGGGSVTRGLRLVVTAAYQAKK